MLGSKVLRYICEAGTHTQIACGLQTLVFQNVHPVPLPNFNIFPGDHNKVSSDLYTDVYRQNGANNLFLSPKEKSILLMQTQFNRLFQGSTCCTAVLSWWDWRVAHMTCPSCTQSRIATSAIDQFWGLNLSIGWGIFGWGSNFNPFEVSNSKYTGCQWGWLFTQDEYLEQLWVPAADQLRPCGCI